MRLVGFRDASDVRFVRFINPDEVQSIDSYWVDDDGEISSSPVGPKMAMVRMKGGGIIFLSCPPAGAATALAGETCPEYDREGVDKSDRITLQTLRYK